MMQLQDILFICQEYESLGSGAHEQLNNIMAGESLAKQDRHLLASIADFLDWASTFDVTEAGELHERIVDYLEQEQPQSADVVE